MTKPNTRKIIEKFCIAASEKPAPVVTVKPEKAPEPGT
jgi:hypothetical protein